MSQVSLIRESDDTLTYARVSLGGPKGTDDFYLVFRGDPQAVVDLLEKAFAVAKEALPAGMYDDRRDIVEKRPV